MKIRMQLIVYFLVETVRWSECSRLLIKTFLPWRLMYTGIQITFRRQMGTSAISAKGLNGYAMVGGYQPRGQAWLLRDQHAFWLIHSFCSCVHFFTWSWGLRVGQKTLCSLKGDFCSSLHVVNICLRGLCGECHLVPYFLVLWQKLSVEGGFCPRAHSVHPAYELWLPFKVRGKGPLFSRRTSGPEA